MVPDLNGQQFETSYHITDNPDFKLDPHYRPEDNTLSISAGINNGRSPHPGVFVADKHGVEAWVNGHDYVRPYVAEIQHPPLQKFGGYSGENFLPAEHFGQTKVSRVIPLDAHARETYGSPGWIEDHHGTRFDTGEKFPERSSDRDHMFPHGYHYNGPDAREMTTYQRAQHEARWRGYMKGNRGWSSEDVAGLPQGHIRAAVAGVNQAFGDHTRVPGRGPSPRFGER